MQSVMSKDYCQASMSSPTSCIFEYYLSLEWAGEVVDVSNLVPEEEREAEQIQKRAAGIIHQMVDKHAKAEESRGKKLYPSVEILDKIPEVNVDTVFQKLNHVVEGIQQQQQQVPSTVLPTEHKKNVTITRPSQIQPDVELPSASSRRPSFLQRPRRMIATSDRNALDRNSSHHRSSHMIPIRANSRQCMSNEEADCRSLDSYSSHHKTSFLNLMPSNSGHRSMSYEDARAAAAAMSRQTEERQLQSTLSSSSGNHSFKMPSYEEARAAAAAASRNYDDRKVGGRECSSNEQHSLHRKPTIHRKPSESLDCFSDGSNHSQYTSSKEPKRPPEHQVENLRYSSPVRRNSPPSMRMNLMQNSPSNMSAQMGRRAQPAPPIEIEIAPGVFSTLRGADETWMAVQNGRVEQLDCICCCTVFMGIGDAEFLLCPECRVVNPLWGPGAPGARGVGLGMTMSEYTAAQQRDSKQSPLSQPHEPMYQLRHSSQSSGMMGGPRSASHHGVYPEECSHSTNGHSFRISAAARV